MSPEMIAGQDVDHRADLFAAGVMLYEQLCGRRPFTGLNTEEVLNRISEGRPKRPTEFDPSVPLALELVCLTALSRDPTRALPLAGGVHLRHRGGGRAGTGGHPRGGGGLRQRHLPRRGGPQAHRPPPRPAGRPLHPHPLARRHRARPAPPARGQPAASRGSADPPRKREPSKRWADRLEAAAPGWARRCSDRWRWSRSLGAGHVAYVTRPSRRRRRRPAPRRAEKAGHPHQRSASSPRSPRIPSATEAELRRAGELALQSSDLEGALAGHPGLCPALSEVASTPRSRRPGRASGLRLGKRADAAIDRALSLDPGRPPAGPAPGRPAPDAGRRRRGCWRPSPGQPEGAQRPGDRRAPGRAAEPGRAARRSLGGARPVLKKRFHPGAAAELGFVKLRQNQPAEAMRLLRDALRPLAQSRQGALLPGRGAGAAGRAGRGRGRVPHRGQAGTQRPAPPRRAVRAPGPEPSGRRCRRGEEGAGRPVPRAGAEVHRRVPAMSAGERRLIINADDLGYDPAINRGIVEAMRQGVVTSATLMVNLPHSGRGRRPGPGSGGGPPPEPRPRRAGEPAPSRPRCWWPARSTSRGWRRFRRRWWRTRRWRSSTRAGELLGQPPTHADVHRHLHRHPERPRGR